MGHNRNRLYSRAIHCPASMEKHYVQWFILKSVCRLLRFVKKLDFAFLSLGGSRHGARVWCLGRVPKHRNQWQEVGGLLFSPQTLSWCIFWAFVPRVWFSYSSFQQVRQPSIPSPVEEDTSKIRDMIGTVFIQGPTIVLPVGAYFELLFLGCGFLIHLSNKSDSPRFRAPWKKIRQKYGTQQEPSLFKGHPLSY